MAVIEIGKIISFVLNFLPEIGTMIFSQIFNFSLLETLQF